MDEKTKRRSKKLLKLAGKRTATVLEEAKSLIEAGVDVDYGTHEEGWTALHEAVCTGNEALAGLLLEHGADARKPLKKKYWHEYEFMPKGTTPLDLARDFEMEELAAEMAGGEDQDEPAAPGLLGRWRAHTIRYQSSPDDDADYVPTDRPAEGDETELELRPDGTCTWSFYGKTRTGGWQRDGDELKLAVEPQAISLRLVDDALWWTDYDEEHGSEVITKLKRQ